jgi:putative sigma-54 modulation protein
MQVTVAARHMDLTDGLRDHVERALEKVTGHFDRVTDADVVLTVEKHRHIAEITLKAPNGLRIHSRESTEDMYASVDAVVDKLDRQARRYKDRLTRFHTRPVEEALGDYQHDIIEFSDNGESNGGVELAPHRVVVRKQLSMRPMSVDEAAMLLDLGNDEFLAFHNADTQRVNVLYKRQDHTFGLIEPQF